MNIFEVSDRSGDTLSIDLDETWDPGNEGRFMTTVSNHDASTIVSTIFGDDAARALIKALRGALPPEQTEVAAPAPTYRPKRADYIRQAIQILRDHNIDFCPGDVVQLAYFLSETGS